MKNQLCGTSLDVVINMIAGQGKVQILYVLHDHPTSFHELKQRVEFTNETLLVRQLNELEADGLVHKQATRHVPRRPTYGMTPIGASLLEALAPLCKWAERYRKQNDGRTLP